MLTETNTKQGSGKDKKMKEFTDKGRKMCLVTLNDVLPVWDKFCQIVKPEWYGQCVRGVTKDSSWYITEAQYYLMMH